MDKMEVARLRDKCSSESIKSHLRVRTRCQFADYGFVKVAAARLRERRSSDSNQSHLLRIRILQYLFHKERFGGESITNTGIVTCGRCGAVLGNYMTGDYFKLIRIKYCDNCKG
ncbi:MAG: hypothetical protein II709_04285, partial [Ruminococcus sp.]|nr:hypothetical protein [Ruminococcus sp.]